MNRGPRPGRVAARARDAVAAVVLAAALLSCSRTPPAEADLVIGNVRLSAGAAPGSIAVAAGRILAAGPDGEVAAHVAERTRRFDLGGAFVAPGATDPLVRPFEIGERLANEAAGGMEYVDLAGTESEEDAVQRVRQRVRVAGTGAFILGAGWDERRWIEARLPDARLLSDIVAFNPVLLVRAGGETGWVNRRALDAAGLQGSGTISGEPLRAVLRKATPMPVEARAAAVERALAAAAARGFTAIGARATGGRLGIDDPAAPESLVIDPWRTLAARGRLPVRVDLLVPAPSAAAEALIARGPESVPGGGRLTIATILIGAGDPEAAAWARRAAGAGLETAILVRDPGGVMTVAGIAAAARAARPDAKVRALVAAGAGLGTAEREMLAVAGLPVADERPETMPPPRPVLATGAWLRPGAPADFVLLGEGPEGLELLATWVGGTEVYRRVAPPRRDPG